MLEGRFWASCTVLKDFLLAPRADLELETAEKQLFRAWE